MKEDKIKQCRVCGDMKPCAWNRRICRDCKGKKYPTTCKGCGTVAMLSYGHVYCKECRTKKWEGGFTWRKCVICGLEKRMSGGRTRCPHCQTYTGKTINMEKIKRLAIDYLGGQCLYCGLVDECPSVYDFHHRNVDEKDGNISTLFYKSVSNSAKRPPRLTEALVAELQKCDLLCVVCHRRLHSPHRDCCQRSLSNAKTALLARAKESAA